MDESNGEEKKDLEVLWTPVQAANYLNLTPHTVYRWLSEKRVLNPDKIVRFSRSVRIPRSEVERIAGITRAKLKNEEPNTQ